LTTITIVTVVTATSAVIAMVTGLALASSRLRHNKQTDHVAILLNIIDTVYHASIIYHHQTTHTYTAIQ